MQGDIYITQANLFTPVHWKKSISTYISQSDIKFNLSQFFLNSTSCKQNTSVKLMWINGT